MSPSHEKRASCLSFISNDANPIGFIPLLIPMVAGPVGTMLVVNIGHANFQQARNLKRNRERGDKSTTEDLVGTYNGITELRIGSCNLSNRTEICTLFSDSQACFKRRIDQTSAVYDDARSSGKEIIHDPSSDRYRVVPRVAPQ